MAEREKSPQEKALDELVAKAPEFQQTLDEGRQVSGETVAASQRIEELITVFADTHTRKHTLTEAAGDLTRKGVRSAQTTAQELARQGMETVQTTARTITVHGLEALQDGTKDLTAPVALAIAASLFTAGAAAFGPEIVTGVEDAWRRSGQPEVMKANPPSVLEELFSEVRDFPADIKQLTDDLTK